MANQFFERKQKGENALLVVVQLPQMVDHEYISAEFTLLAKSAGANIIKVISVNRTTPEIKYFIGKGKVFEITNLLASLDCDLVIFNSDLSPAQERNLEKSFECRVLDRTGLILDIFASRAKSHAGKLQVELAQLKHLSSRLIRGWTHLERQKGGIGLRGPGETQLESDRRMIALRIKQINKKLAKVSSTRNLSRQARKKAQLATVSLIGYTNAGKSTLFNYLVDEKQYAQDRLFATLDATLRQLKVSPHLKVILADTVGFISQLPHTLVESFKSTLEETVEADLLLHVIDVAADNYREQISDVIQVLGEIKADKIPMLEVRNKIDLLDDFQARIDRDEFGKPIRVWLSAVSGLGVDLLLQCLEEIFSQNILEGELKLSCKDGDIRAKLFNQADVLKEDYDNDGNCRLHIRVNKSVLQKNNLLKKFTSFA